MRICATEYVNPMNNHAASQFNPQLRYHRGNKTQKATTNDNDANQTKPTFLCLALRHSNQHLHFTSLSFPSLLFLLVQSSCILGLFFFLFISWFISSFIMQFPIVPDSNNFVCLLLSLFVKLHHLISF